MSFLQTKPQPKKDLATKPTGPTEPPATTPIGAPLPEAAPPSTRPNDETLNYHNALLANAGDNIYNEGCYLVGWTFLNTTASARFVHFYDRQGLPVTGGDKPESTELVPANNRNFMSGLKIPFARGLAISVSTGASDTDNGTATAGDVVVQVFYMPRVRGAGGWQ